MMEKDFIAHAYGNNLEGLNDCLSRGVDVNFKQEEQNGRTALIISCSLGHSALVSRLVQVPGLDIDCEDKLTATAAHHASCWGRTECVRILANTGRVDWNKEDLEGRTPLYYALWQGHSDIVDIIVKQPNIDYNVKTTFGTTLAQIAVQGDPLSVVKCVETLAAQETFDCWNVPIAHNGETPVMWALKLGKIEIVEILLRCPRVDLDCRDKEGWSVLLRAIQGKYQGNNQEKKIGN